MSLLLLLMSNVISVLIQPTPQMYALLALSGVLSPQSNLHVTPVVVI